MLVLEHYLDHGVSVHVPAVDLIHAGFVLRFLNDFMHQRGTSKDLDALVLL